MNPNCPKSHPVSELSSVAHQPMIHASGIRRPARYLCAVVLALITRLAFAQSPAPDDLNPSVDSYVYAIAVQTDGRVLVGGSFTSIAGQACNVIGRLDPDGALDSSFNPGAGPKYSSVETMAVQADGKILLGGTFTTLGGQTRNRIGRLKPDGTLDASFNPGADGVVSSMAVQPDGKILVGGHFTMLGRQSRSRIARLNPDGTLDSGFKPEVIVHYSGVLSLALQADGRILVGGGFSSLGGQPRKNLGRLNPDGTLDDSFNPGTGEGDYPYVHCLAVQADGKILVGGAFTTLGGQPRNYIGRLHPDGTLDDSFNPGTGDGNRPEVRSLAVQADGKILAGGWFTALGGQPRAYIGRLNPDGTVDSSFNPGANGWVYSLAVQMDGKVLVGGQFTTLAGQARNRIGRLNATEPATQNLNYDGAAITWLRGGSSSEVWRTTFDYSTDGVSWINLGEGIRIAGGWQRTNVIVPTGATLRARGCTVGGQQSASGWLVEDYWGPPVFVAQPTSQTRSAGSTVVFLAPAGGTPPLTYQWFKNGVPLANGGNVAGALTPALKLTDLLRRDEGVFHVVASSGSGSLTSLVATLTVNDPVIAVQPLSQTREPGQNASMIVSARGTEPLQYQWWKDGQKLVAGTEASLNLTNLQAGDAGAYHVVVTNLHGSVTSAVAALVVNQATLDSSPNLTANGQVHCLAIQADGRILVGGKFNLLGGQTRRYLGRLNPDGTLDSSFNPGANNYVYSLAVQADGKILAGGLFTTLGGQPRGRIGRLHPSGAVDDSFNPGALADAWGNALVFSLAEQADGKILVGGWFLTLGGQPRKNIGRLDPDGTPDASFNPGAGFDVNCVAIQPDGKILLGGQFGTLGGQSRDRIGRLHPTGLLDSGFNPGANSVVNALALQADGKILVGGGFTTLGGQARNYLGRLNVNGSLDGSFNPSPNGVVNALAVQADGKIVVGGSFTMLSGQPQSCIGRLNPDGTLDSGLNPGVESNDNTSLSVLSLAVQADGKVVLGGNFTSLGGQPRQCLGRLNPTEPAIQIQGYDGSTLSWLRGGSSPEVWRTTFEYSTDGVFWHSLGEGIRVSGGWQQNAVIVPPDAYIRARGYTVGLSWFVESLRQWSPPRLSLLSAFGSVQRFKLTGEAGTRYTIQTTTNLPVVLPWESFLDLTLSNGWGAFDWTNTGEARRLFRAHRE